MAEKNILAERPLVEKVQIPEVFVFVEYRYLQHGGYGWRTSHGLRCKTYLISASYHMKVVIVFDYGASFAFK